MAHGQMRLWMGKEKVRRDYMMKDDPMFQKNIWRKCREQVEYC